VCSCMGRGRGSNDDYEPQERLAYSMYIILRSYLAGLRVRRCGFVGRGILWSIRSIRTRDKGHGGAFILLVCADRTSLHVRDGDGSNLSPNVGLAAAHFRISLSRAPAMSPQDTRKARAKFRVGQVVMVRKSEIGKSLPIKIERTNGYEYFDAILPRHPYTEQELRPLTKRERGA
jgi:hypothetical protein